MDSKHRIVCLLPIFALLLAFSWNLESCSSTAEESSVQLTRPEIRYLKNKCLLVRGDLLNGMEEGVWEYYYLDTMIHSRGSYRQGTRVGQWEFYAENGILKESGAYWYNDSLIQENLKADSFDLDFHQEIMESSEVPQYGGDMEIWGACPIDSGDFDDFMGGDDFGGEDFSVFLVRQNLKHGQWNYYDDKGKLIEVQQYAKGELVGTLKVD